MELLEPLERIDPRMSAAKEQLKLLEPLKRLDPIMSGAVGLLEPMDDWLG